MQQRRLGRSGLNVSVVGMGTAQLRLIPERRAIETIKAALTAGVNIFHTAPDYEGTDNLILTAIKECDPLQKVYICNVAWGDPAFFESVFERTCRKLDTECLDIFGIASIHDQELLNQNVWGRGGMVEFLQRKKEQGRLKAAFCSTHGPPRHTAELLKRDVFDVIMLSHNQLGFHLLSYNPDNFPELAGMADRIKGKWEFEKIPEIEPVVFPIIEQLDIGLMVMKPFAGGLLTTSKAFPPRLNLGTDKRGDLPELILKSLLRHQAVSCVVPGTASVEEALQNASVGAKPLELTGEQITRLNDHVLELRAKLCDRCGACDTSCAKKLKISWLFRAAYIALFPSATHENMDYSEYFTLHPQAHSLCAACRDATCHCPRGIDIKTQLTKIHGKLLKLADQGGIRGLSERRYGCSSERSGHAFTLLRRDIPKTLRPGEQTTLCLHLRNNGDRVWYADLTDNKPLLYMAFYADNQLIAAPGPRVNVPPGEQAHWTITYTAPPRPGKVCLQMDLFETKPWRVPQPDSPFLARLGFRVARSFFHRVVNMKNIRKNYWQTLLGERVVFFSAKGAGPIEASVEIATVEIA